MTPEAIDERFKSLNSIIVNLERTIAGLTSRLDVIIRLEEQHVHNSRALDRAFGVIKENKEIAEKDVEEIRATSDRYFSDLETRIARVEVDMPGLKELRRWVIGGLAVALTTLMGSVVSLDRSNAKQQEFLQQLLLLKPPIAERIPLNSK